jgi:hypothetical protein
MLYYSIHLWATWFIPDHINIVSDEPKRQGWGCIIGWCAKWLAIIHPKSTRFVSSLKYLLQFAADQFNRYLAYTFIGGKQAPLTKLLFSHP